MKTIFIFLSLIPVINAFSQDIDKLKRIDSIVTSINYSRIKPDQDSTIQNMPDQGLTIKTYLAMIVENNQLRKYVNYVITNRIENGAAMKTTSCNTFYYDQSSLIKVEECVLSGNQAMQFEWYFSAAKCIYHSLQSDKAGSRADLLLSMSAEMLKNITRKPN